MAMTRLEALARVAGLLAIVVAFAAVDLRAGLAALGVVLILATLNLEIRRPT